MIDLDFLSVIDEKKQLLEDTALFLWEHPETAFTEFESAKYLCQVLRDEGFEVTENLAGISTAFCGRFGSGKPVIGLLGEFDALSGLNQTPMATEKCSLGGSAGHGCGHNLLGTGSLGAAIAAKRYLEETGKPGTVIYYGCPGEEGGSGKAFMAREGVFDKLDFALTWHPSDTHGTGMGSSVANYQIIYRFYGISAHAGGAPWNGRSALDALELMNTGVQYLREHVPTDTRIHYAITNTGGYSPNVVQAYAEVTYLIRAKNVEAVQNVYERINKIADGAALMTETRVEKDFVKGCSNLIPNRVLADLLQKNLLELPKPQLKEEDFKMAKAIVDSIPEASRVDLSVRLAKIKDRALRAKLYEEHKDDVIYEFVLPVDEDETPMGASTDVSDVSWCCPTHQCYTATIAAGTPGHSWQMVSQGKSNLAHEGMLYAARVMAGTAIDAILDPAIIEAAKADFAARMDGKKYMCPIPKGVMPRVLSAKK
jgi:aminobenzoyl-glutamate utilization protein B